MRIKEFLEREKSTICLLLLFFACSLFLLLSMKGITEADRGGKWIICGDSTPRDYPVVIDVVSPSAAGVLFPGDTIISVNGERVAFCWEITSLLSDVNTLVVTRDGKTTQVVLAFPSDDMVNKERPFEQLTSQ